MVRCADCGFLSHYCSDTRTLEPFEKDEREKGLPFPIGGGLQQNFGWPVCFQAAYDLPAECNASQRDPGADPGVEMSRITLQVITTDRLCESFVKWHRGLSLKEHREMLYIKEQREWQEECRRKDLEWKAEQERLAAERWEIQYKLQRGQFWWIGIFGTAVLAFVAIIGALATILGALIASHRI